jgi:hypothetical protein
MELPGVEPGTSTLKDHFHGKVGKVSAPAPLISVSRNLIILELDSLPDRIVYY